MELMNTSLDNFYQLLSKKEKQLPENVLGKIAFAVRIVLFSHLAFTCSKSTAKTPE